MKCNECGMQNEEPQPFSINFSSNGIVSLRTNDAVISPAHYQTESGLEAIDVIEAFDLGYCLGNAFKYMSRWDKKDSPLENGEKTVWFVVRRLYEDGHKDIHTFLRKLADKYEEEYNERNKNS